jgi:hypothetical protein
MNLKDKIYTFITSKTLPSTVLNTKVGQIMTEVLDSNRTYGLSLQIIAKGFNQDGVPNESYDIEPTDLVRGWADIDNYWYSAMYIGGDPDDLANYRYGVKTNYSEARDETTF